MYEMMFYSGLVIAIFSFLIALILFFHYKIPKTFMYLIKMGNKKIPKSEQKIKKITESRNSNIETDDSPTNILDDEDTSILSDYTKQ